MATIGLLAALILAAVLAAGCASGGYGRLHHDAEISRLFSTNAVPDYYRYYTTGRSKMPYAIIGIDPRYQIGGAHWEPVAPNTQEFAQKVSAMWRPNIWEQYDPAEGAWIKAPNGDELGIWYSMYPYATIRMADDNRVEILSPFNPSRE